YWCERLPMQWRWAMFAQSCEMFGRAIAFVRTEAVRREDWIPLADHAVTVDLGQYRCGGDGSGECVAVNDGLLWHLAIEAHGIDKEIIGSWAELRDCVVHGKPRRMIDVDLIDARGIDRCNRPYHGMFSDAFG